MSLDPRDAPPGCRAVPSDGHCRCAKTGQACRFSSVDVLGHCWFPKELKRANQLQSCMDSVRKDGFLAVFLEGEEPYGNEED